MTSTLQIEGLASLALLPNGGISGHLIDAATKNCYGILGKEIKCERECSRGEDYKLVDLSILDFKSQKECSVVVEQRGADAARIRTAEDAHGWEEEVLDAAREGRTGAVPEVTFDCETLKADADALLHIQRFLPSLQAQDAVVNVGKMVVSGIKFEVRKRTRKRGSEETVNVDVSSGHDEPGGNEERGNGWSVKRWKLEEGADGRGWFTRTLVSKTKRSEVGSNGRYSGSPADVGAESSGQGEASEAKQEPSNGAVPTISERAGQGHECGEGILAAATEKLQSAKETACERTLGKELKSVEEAFGISSEGQPPKLLSRKILGYDDADKDDGWL